MSIEFDTPRGTVVVFGDPERLAFGVAELITAEARRTSTLQEGFSLALSGGATPQEAYRLLSDPPFRDEIPWTRVHVLFVDERWVDIDDPRSNEGMIRAAFLDAVPIARGRVHSMRAAASPSDAAAHYDALLHRAFAERGKGPDLVLLGLGPDGHTASLFPTTPAVTERRRYAVEVFVDAATAATTTAGDEDMWRVTLTAPFINTASAVVFVATGSAKARVIHEIIEGPDDPGRLPAQMIRPSDGVVLWYLDTEAAALLSR